MPNNDKALQIVEKLQQKSQRLFGNELETSTGDLLNSMEQQAHTDLQMLKLQQGLQISKISKSKDVISALDNLSKINDINKNIKKSEDTFNAIKEANKQYTVDNLHKNLTTNYQKNLELDNLSIANPAADYSFSGRVMDMLSGGVANTVQTAGVVQDLLGKGANIAVDGLASLLSGDFKAYDSKNNRAVWDKIINKHKNNNMWTDLANTAVSPLTEYRKNLNSVGLYDDVMTDVVGNFKDGQYAEGSKEALMGLMHQTPYMLGSLMTKNPIGMGLYTLSAIGEAQKSREAEKLNTTSSQIMNLDPNKTSVGDFIAGGLHTLSAKIESSILTDMVKRGFTKTAAEKVLKDAQGAKKFSEVHSEFATKHPELTKKIESFQEWLKPSNGVQKTFNGLKKAGTVAGGITLDAGAESFSEVLDTFGEMLNQGDFKDKSFYENYKKLRDAAVAGGIYGGMTSTALRPVGYAHSKYKEAQEIKQVKEGKTNINTLLGGDTFEEVYANEIKENENKEFTKEYKEAFTNYWRGLSQKVNLPPELHAKHVEALQKELETPQGLKTFKEGLYHAANGDLGLEIQNEYKNTLENVIKEVKNIVNSSKTIEEFMKELNDRSGLEKALFLQAIKNKDTIKESFKNVFKEELKDFGSRAEKISDDNKKQVVLESINKVKERLDGIIDLNNKFHMYENEEIKDLQSYIEVLHKVASENISKSNGKSLSAEMLFKPYKDSAGIHRQSVAQWYLDLHEMSREELSENSDTTKELKRYINSQNNKTSTYQTVINNADNIEKGSVVVGNEIFSGSEITAMLKGTSKENLVDDFINEKIDRKNYLNALRNSNTKLASKLKFPNYAVAIQNMTPSLSDNFKSLLQDINSENEFRNSLDETRKKLLEKKNKKAEGRSSPQDIAEDIMKEANTTKKQKEDEKPKSDTKSETKSEVKPKNEDLIQEEINKQEKAKLSNHIRQLIGSSGNLDENQAIELKQSIEKYSNLNNGTFVGALRGIHKTLGDKAKEAFIAMQKFNILDENSNKFINSINDDTPPFDTDPKPSEIKSETKPEQTSSTQLSNNGNKTTPVNDIIKSTSLNDFVSLQQSFKKLREIYKGETQGESVEEMSKALGEFKKGRDFLQALLDMKVVHGNSPKSVEAIQNTLDQYKNQEQQQSNNNTEQVQTTTKTNQTIQNEKVIPSSEVKQEVSENINKNTNTDTKSKGNEEKQERIENNLNTLLDITDNFNEKTKYKNYEGKELQSNENTEGSLKNKIKSIYFKLKDKFSTIKNSTSLFADPNTVGEASIKVEQLFNSILEIPIELQNENSTRNSDLLKKAILKRVGFTFGENGELTPPNRIINYYNGDLKSINLLTSFMSDEGVLSSSIFRALELILNTSLNSSKSDEDFEQKLESLGNIRDDMPPALRNAVKNGAFKNQLVDILADKIFKDVGLKFNENTTYLKEYQRLTKEISNYILTALEDVGILNVYYNETTNENGEIVRELPKSHSVFENSNEQSTLTIYTLNKNTVMTSNRTINPNMLTYTQAIQAFNDLAKSLGVEVDQELRTYHLEPVTDIPISMKVKGRGNQMLTNTQQEYLRVMANTKYKVPNREEVLKLFKDENKVNSIKNILGYIDISAYKKEDSSYDLEKLRKDKGIVPSEIPGIEGKNSEIEKSISDLTDFLEAKNDKGEYVAETGVYFSSYFAFNRAYLASSTVNPQTNKLHRFFIVPEKAVENIKLEYDKNGNLVVDPSVANGIAQGLGYDTDKANSDAATKFVENILKENAGLKFIDSILNNLLEGKEVKLSTGEKISISEFSHTYNAIENLKILKKAQMENSSTAETYQLAEADGINNGIALKLFSFMQSMTTVDNLLSTGIDIGMTNSDLSIKGNNTIASLFEDTKSGVLDAYKKFGVIFKDKIGENVEQDYLNTSSSAIAGKFNHIYIAGGKKKHENIFLMFHSLLYNDLLSKNISEEKIDGKTVYKVSKLVRTIMKPILTVLQYGAGTLSTARKLVNDPIYKKGFFNILNEGFKNGLLKKPNDEYSKRVLDTLTGTLISLNTIEKLDDEGKVVGEPRTNLIGFTLPKTREFSSNNPKVKLPRVLTLQQLQQEYKGTPHQAITKWLYEHYISSPYELKDIKIKIKGANDEIQTLTLFSLVETYMEPLTKDAFNETLDSVSPNAKSVTAAMNLVNSVTTNINNTLLEEARKDLIAEKKSKGLPLDLTLKEERDLLNLFHSRNTGDGIISGTATEEERKKGIGFTPMIDKTKDNSTVDKSEGNRVFTHTNGKLADFGLGNSITKFDNTGAAAAALGIQQMDGAHGQQGALNSQIDGQLVVTLIHDALCGNSKQLVGAAFEYCKNALSQLLEQNKILADKVVDANRQMKKTFITRFYSKDKLDITERYRNGTKLLYDFLKAVHIVQSFNTAIISNGLISYANLQNGLQESTYNYTGKLAEKLKNMSEQEKYKFEFEFPNGIKDLMLNGTSINFLEKVVGIDADGDHIVEYINIPSVISSLLSDLSSNITPALKLTKAMEALEEFTAILNSEMSTKEEKLGKIFGEDFVKSLNLKQGIIDIQKECDKIKTSDFYNLVSSNIREELSEEKQENYKVDSTFNSIFNKWKNDEDISENEEILFNTLDNLDLLNNDFKGLEELTNNSLWNTKKALLSLLQKDKIKDLNSSVSKIKKALRDLINKEVNEQRDSKKLDNIERFNEIEENDVNTIKYQETLEESNKLKYKLDSIPRLKNVNIQGDKFATTINLSNSYDNTYELYKIDSGIYVPPKVTENNGIFQTVGVLDGTKENPNVTVSTSLYSTHSKVVKENVISTDLIINISDDFTSNGQMDLRQAVKEVNDANKNNSSRIISLGTNTSMLKGSNVLEFIYNPILAAEKFVNTILLSTEKKTGNYKYFSIKDGKPLCDIFIYSEMSRFGMTDKTQIHQFNAAMNIFLNRVNDMVKDKGLNITVRSMGGSALDKATVKSANSLGIRTHIHSKGKTKKETQKGKTYKDMFESFSDNEELSLFTNNIQNYKITLYEWKIKNGNTIQEEIANLQGRLQEIKASTRYKNENNKKLAELKVMNNINKLKERLKEIDTLYNKLSEDLIDKSNYTLITPFKELHELDISSLNRYLNDVLYKLASKHNPNTTFRKDISQDELDILVSNIVNLTTKFGDIEVVKSLQSQLEKMRVIEDTKNKVLEEFKSLTKTFIDYDFAQEEIKKSEELENQISEIKKDIPVDDKYVLSNEFKFSNELQKNRDRLNEVADKSNNEELKKLLKEYDKVTDKESKKAKNLVESIANELDIYYSFGDKVDTTVETKSTNTIIKENAILNEETLLDNQQEMRNHDKEMGRELDENESNRLKNLLSMLAKLAKGKLEDITLDVIETNETSDKGGYNPNTGKVTIKRTKRKAGYLGLLSSEEVYAHEITHALLEAAIRVANGFTGYGRQLLQAYSQYLSQMTAEKLATYLDYDSKEKNLEVAKAIFTHISDDDLNIAVNEFLTIALTNKGMYKSLLDVNFNTKEKSTNNKEFKPMEWLLQAVSDFIENAISILFRGYKKDSNLQDVINGLSKNIAKANSKASMQKNIYNRKASNSIIESNIDKADKIVSDKIKDFIGMLTKAGIKGFSLPTGNGLNERVSLLTRVIMKSNISPEIKEHATNLLGEVFDTKGSIQSILKDLGDMTKSGRIAEALARASSRIDRVRNALSSSIQDVIVNTYFKNQLSPKDDQILGETLLDSDLSVLIDSYSITDIESFVNNPSKGIDITKQKLLNTIEKNWKKPCPLSKKEYIKYLDVQANALAYYMINHIAANKVEQSILNPNATLIAKLARMSDKGLYNADENIINALDEYITALSLKHMDKEKRNALSQIFNRDIEGIQNCLNAHKDFKTKSLVNNFNNNKAQMMKGYRKDIYENGLTWVTASIEDRALLESQGFEMITESIEQYVDLKMPKRAIFVSTFVSPTSGFQRQAMRYTDTSSKGLSVVDSLFEKMNKGVDKESLRKEAGEIIENLKQKMYRNMRVVMSDNYHQTIENEHNVMSSLRPIFDEDGNIANFVYVVPKSTKTNYLRANTKFSESLAMMESNSFDKAQTIKQNKEVNDFLVDDWNKVKGTSGEELFTELSYRSEDPYIKEIYTMLPRDTLRDLKKKFKGEPIMVRKSLLLETFGIRDMDFRNTEFYKNNKDPHAKLIKSGMVIGAEFIKMATKIVKFEVVTRLPSVVVTDIISNGITCVLEGMSPTEVIKLYWDGFRNLKLYDKQLQQVYKLEQEIKGNVGDINYKERMLNNLRKALSANPVNELIEHGLWTSIDSIDDNQFNKEPAGYLERKYDDWSEKHKKIRWVLDSLFVTKNTAIGKRMTAIVQASDFCARYTLLHKCMRKGMDKKDALNHVSDRFINYDLPTSKWIKFFNDYGFVLFTRYITRIQKQGIGLMTDRPVSAGLYLTAQLLTGINMTDMIDSMWFNRDMTSTITNPIDMIDKAFVSPVAVSMVNDLYKNMDNFH